MVKISDYLGIQGTMQVSVSVFIENLHFSKNLM